MKFIKIVANTFLILVVIVFVILPMKPDVRVGMVMLVGFPYAIWWLLRGIKSRLNKTPDVEGYEAFNNNIPKSNNPYLKPIAEIEDMESAELWFTGYIAAEQKNT